MLFETVSIKKKTPNTGFHRNKVVVINAKTGEMKAIQPGMVWDKEDWEDLTSNGFTHWLKPISIKKVKEKYKWQERIDEMNKQKNNVAT